jgi:hypothetical protein
MYLHFFQLRPPMPTDGVPEAIAESVASVAVDIDKIESFINVMQQQLNVAKQLIAAQLRTGNAAASGEAQYTFLDEGSAAFITQTSRLGEPESAMSSLASMMRDDTLSPEGSQFVKAAIANKSAKLKIVPRVLHADR